MAGQKNASGDTNISYLVAGACGLMAWHWWPGDNADVGHHLMAWLLSGTALAGSLGGTRSLLRDMRNRKVLLDAEIAGTDHGSAREATEAEMEKRGMFNPGSGTFLGFAYGRAVFAPADAPFVLSEGPPGSGKDINLTVGDILHHSLLGHSVLAPDVKLELGPMLIEGLKRAGVETWAINPTGQFTERCGDTEISLYQGLIDAVHGDAHTRKDAVGLAREIGLLHLPDEATDKGKQYFAAGARRCIVLPALLYALIDPAECVPAKTYDLLNDPEKFLRILKGVVSELEPAGEDAEIVAFLKSEARNLINRADTNPENFGSFLEWATQVLGPYNQASHLAGYGRQATEKLKSMTERPITVFPMTPHSHAVEFESFTSILNANVLAACKRNPKKQRVHLCCNEFLNYRFGNIASDLEVMRGLGLTATFYIQSFSGLVRKYGKEAAASVNDYCDVKIYMGLNSYERARHVSEMLSETTIAGKEYSYRLHPDEPNVSTRRHGRRLMTPDEILAMPRDEAWVFVKGLRPFRVTMAHYGQIEPWKSLVGDNPLEGQALTGKTLLEIDYGRENCR